MGHLLSEFALSQLQVVLERLQVLIILQHLHKTFVWVAQFDILRVAIVQLDMAQFTLHRFLHDLLLLSLLSHRLLHDLLLERHRRLLLLSRCIGYSLLVFAKHLVEFFE